MTAFFAHTLGWKVRVDDLIRPNAAYVSVGTHTIAGLSDLANPIYPPGLPAHIAHYLATSDIDRTTIEASKAGAQILLHPFDAGREGRIATILDPFGATVSLFQRTASPGWTHPKGMPATPVGLRHTSRSPEQAAHFYRETLGLQDPTAEFADTADTAVAAAWRPVVSVLSLDMIRERVATSGGTFKTYGSKEPSALLTAPDGLSLWIRPW